MKAIKGSLLTCDPAVKQLILQLNERMRFVIQDLDETHLLVSTDRVEWMRIELETELEKNTWSIEG
ncbi:nucleotide excision repair, TFIIH, subunit [Tilletiopsis washingtonensis]|uniref:General transcription and DNA repair factor IIH subunit TFB5 n=1 Tax=Tilletiopsis washingtonensis TaxID=58919 RepID=A0A316ZCG4_9BASI|nr:nucleotide excision repair, TFIIH, subunit [Tilletiopsis washingtonensis]PWN99219.1 nucleotide excision repair, TFIIH, subunit [Tilletiopsis washingtonensis]